MIIPGFKPCFENTAADYCYQGKTAAAASPSVEFLPDNCAILQLIFPIIIGIRNLKKSGGRLLMKNEELNAWLFENGGPVIRYRTATELLPQTKSLDIKRLAARNNR